nr:hypothetical protein [Tanacetum cinerariifolium]
MDNPRYHGNPPRATATITNATMAALTIGHQGHPPQPSGRHHNTDGPQWDPRSATKARTTTPTAMDNPRHHGQPPRATATMTNASTAGPPPRPPTSTADPPPHHKRPTMGLLIGHNDTDDHPHHRLRRPTTGRPHLPALPPRRCLLPAPPASSPAPPPQPADRHPLASLAPGGRPRLPAAPTPSAASCRPYHQPRP